MKLRFLGATETVTGSKYLIEANNKKILVDCGLFQGYKALRLRNWEPLPIDPASLDAVIITHAHIDHTGYLPLLVKKGFKGPVYATEATVELCNILLPDSGYLHEEDARRANKYGYTKHHPALPLYTQEDAEIALNQLTPVCFGKTYHLFDNIAVTWHRAGHILGAAFIQIEVNGTRVTFSGDVGRLHDPVMYPPEPMPNTDYLILESTYGNRLHKNSNPIDYIRKIVKKTAHRGGTTLIPAFAVGRAQSILYYLYQLRETGSIPYLPTYLDSPMAIDATTLMLKYNQEVRLSADECRRACSMVTYTNTPDESRALDQQAMPKIIISASGMMTGGRILHHLKALAPDPHNTILMTGFQAGGTRGARLLNGEKTLKIHGQHVPINAEVAYLTNTSAHADYQEMLVWLEQCKLSPRKVFITHGEPHAAKSLKKRLQKQFGWRCHIPHYLDEEPLD